MNKKVIVFLLLICFITFIVLSIRISTSPNLNDENNDLVYEEIREDILRYKSPYIEAGYEDEKYYLLNKYIFAVKLRGEFFNLISMDYVKEDKRQPYLYIEYANLFEYDL